MHYFYFIISSDSVEDHPWIKPTTNSLNPFRKKINIQTGKFLSIDYIHLLHRATGCWKRKLQVSVPCNTNRAERDQEKRGAAIRNKLEEIQREDDNVLLYCKSIQRNKEYGFPFQPTNSERKFQRCSGITVTFHKKILRNEIFIRLGRSMRILKSMRKKVSLRKFLRMRFRISSAKK